MSEEVILMKNRQVLQKAFVFCSTCQTVDKGTGNTHIITKSLRQTADQSGHSEHSEESFISFGETTKLLCAFVAFLPSRSTKSFRFLQHLFHIFLFFECSLNRLDNLHNRDDGNCKSHCNEVFLNADVFKSECVTKERNIDNRCCENERKDHCTPEELVLVLDCENGLSS